MTGAAVIGCGLVGLKRARALRDRGIPVLAVHDAARERADALAMEIGGVAVAETPEAAVKATGVSLAIVATTHASLAPLAVIALQAGCNVLVEKPGGHSLADLEVLAAEAAASRRLVRVGFNHRFHPAVLKARELVRDGRYGRVMHLRARYGHGGRRGYEHEWRAQRALSGGGELLDQGVHLVDLVRFNAGEASLAFAELRTEFWPVEVEDNAYLALRTADGAFAWLHASWTEWKNLFSFEIALESAKIEISGLGGSYGVERLTLHEMLPDMGPPLTRAWEWPRGDDSWSLEVDDVLAAVAGRPSVGAGLDDALAAFRIVDQAYTR